MKDLKFSVLMSVYQKDHPEHFKLAMESVLHQSLVPDEVVLVLDGPITKELEKQVLAFTKNNPSIKVHKIPTNTGLGNALREGLLLCKHELVARMDSDDIASFHRFALQVACFKEQQDLSIVGGNIAEFIGEIDNLVGRRVVPESHEDIVVYMKKRCGFNHMTVMFKKSEVIKAGNYQEWFCNEDYYLWIRMQEQGCIFKNLSEDLVKVRVGEAMYQRRGGFHYFKSEYGLQKYMRKKKLITGRQFFYNISLRFILQVIMPNKIRGWCFRTFARK